MNAPPPLPWPKRDDAAPTWLTVGTMNFGKRTKEDEAHRIVERALARGLRVFDTANVYVDGESERILGRALAGRRGEVHVATKVGSARANGKPEGLARATIDRSIDESLARLGTDHVDVYYLHVPDPKTPLEESVRAMIDVVKSGRARAWAMSNHASWQVLDAMRIAEREGAPGPMASQVIYNLLVRQIEIEHLRFAKAHPIHVTVYNALAGGLLAGKHRKDAIPKGSRFDKNPMYQRRYWTERFFQLVDALAAIAASEAMTLAALAYAWLAHRPGVDSILLGPASVEQLDFAIDACARPVSEGATAAIDALHRDYLGTDATYAR